MQPGLHGKAYNFRLPATYLERGVTNTGGVRQLVEKLNGGLPVSIVALGSSVAEAGGCFDSTTSSRCGLYSGRGRHDSGFIVRFFDWMNGTWPHAGHRLLNGARGATSIHAILPCLLSYFDDPVDLVIVEPGSMSYSWATTEKGRSSMETVVRKLLTLRQPAPADSVVRRQSSHVGPP